MHALVSRAKAKKEVTVAMVITKAGLDVSEKVALEAFHDHDIYFHKIFEKPVLEPEDVHTRQDWCEKRRARRSSGFVNHMRLWITRPLRCSTRRRVAPTLPAGAFAACIAKQG